MAERVPRVHCAGEALCEHSTRRPAMRPATTFARLLLTIALITVGPLWLVPEADARITRVQVTTHETPTFGGYSWPGVGQYEKIVGVAFGEVDPTNPQDGLITDISLAPRNG